MSVVRKRAERAEIASQKTRRIARLAQILGDEKHVASG
jgi:hypothetical protein